MRRTIIAIASAAVLLLPVWLALRAQSGTIFVRVTSSARDIRVEEGDGGTSITPSPAAPANFSRLNDPGRPALPVRVVNVLIPNGRRFVTVEASSARRSVVASSSRLVLGTAPGPSPDDPARPAAGPSPEPLAPDAGTGTFPSESVRYLGTGVWHGYSIASFAVFPLRVEGDDVAMYGDIELRVETAPGASGTGARAQRATRAAAERIDAALRGMVSNPGDAAGYPPIRPVDMNGPFSPVGVPSLEGSPVEYVIVTTDALAASFDSLATWKTARGVPTVVRTVEWIEANYRRGTDRAETVRFFLQDAYVKWGVTWALIAGDTPEIPARYLYSAYYYGGTSIPCDLYFAALDGTFNADGDTRFGEQPADSPDLYAELNIGRLPVSTPAAANTVIGKIKTYETPGDSTYTDKVIHLAEVLFPAPWPPGPILQNGADVLQYINAIYIADPSRRVTRCFETHWLYSGSVLETRDIALDSLEAGYNQVFHVGHGYRFNMHCGDESIAIPEADALYHPGRFFNLYMLNCTAAAFDYDCLGEHMLRNPVGGAVSVLGATNSAFADVSAYYMEDYADVLYQYGVVRVSDAFTTARARRVPYAQVADNADLWTQYIYCVLADPEMPMWTGPVPDPLVSHPDSVVAGTNAITVDVMVGGMPPDTAFVCLWKDGEDYQLGPTDAGGQKSFTFSTPTAGTVRVVVSGPNLARYEGSIKVGPAPGAMLVVDSVVVDDDSLAGTSGNGDGIVDAGETVDLTPVIRNAGGTATAAATAALATSSSIVTLVDDTVSLPPLEPGALAPASDAWRVQVEALAPDEAAARFTTVITAGLSSWNAGFAKVVHAPRLELVRLRKSDAIPVGNGDGVITNGEQFQLFAAIKNYGTGRADGLTAVLRSLDAGSTVFDSTTSFASLPQLVEGENTVPFRLSEANVALTNLFLLTVTDSYGRTWGRVIELRGPAAPVILSFDSSLGVDKMLVTWMPSLSTDVHGYLVYRASAFGGPYSRAGADVVLHTVFTDAGLAPSTRYYYAISAIDDSGNESTLSAIASASTNPPQLAGWPNELVDPSANSPSVGDIDGDGDLEVVIGNDLLYAWNADGSEVRDGDGQALTWGVFSPLGEDFIGPAALAKLDADTGLDIVAAAYTAKLVFCFNADGSVLPGWPQPTIDLVRAGTVVGDIDGDESPEILAVDQDAYLYAWHVNGTEVIDGDANPLTHGVFKRLPDTNQWQYQMPALADLDADGKEEIIIPTQDKKLYVFNETGGNEPGWPFSLPDYGGGGVAIGDIDNNGDLEIVVTVRNNGAWYALHHTGTQMWVRWRPTSLFFNPSPALADLTGDGKLEAVIPASDGKLYATQYNGTDAPGWPVIYSTKTYSESSPVIADLDGDGFVDVLLGDEGKFINAWSAAGVPLDGFPLVMKDAVRGTPTVEDLDRDGTVEIVAVGYDKTVYVWSLPAAYNPNRAPWPMFHTNNHRNGLHGFVVPTGVGDDAAVPRALKLDQNYPNPFNPATTISYEIAEGAPQRAVLAVYDVTGARVRTLVDRVARPGRYSATWDGRNANGEPVSSGIYFYRLSTPERALTRKMLLLK